MGKEITKLIGSWAFLLGVIIAIGFGIMLEMELLNGQTQVFGVVLVCIGLIVGLLNVTHKESNRFIVSGVSLVLVSTLGMNLMATVPYIGSVLVALLMIFVPATIVVAIRNVFDLAKN